MPIKKPLNRRTFLKGAGVALALPFMEAMLPINRSWAAEPPKFGMMYSGVGLRSDPTNLTPIRTIHPEIRQIFSPFNAQATYLTGLINDGITNNHDELAGFMAGVHSLSYKTAVSIDRVMAEHLGPAAIFKDGLYVGSEARGAQSSSIYRAMSQKNGSQSTMYSDPRVLFDLMTSLGSFKSNGTAPAMDPLKRDVLSLSLNSIKSLKRELSSSDNAVLDKHLTAIEQIQNNLGGGASQCAAPTGVAASYPSPAIVAKMTLIADIAALAFNCDLTRSFSFLIFPDGAGSNVAHTHLYDGFEALYGSRPGVGYHEWTHRRWLNASNTGNQNTNRCQASMLASDKWDASIAARFLSKLNSEVLESSVFGFGSGGSYNGGHPSDTDGVSSHYNIPFVMFGKLGGKLKPAGQTLHREQSVCNLWLTLLQKTGSQMTSFGKLREPTKTIDLG